MPWVASLFWRRRHYEDTLDYYTWHFDMQTQVDKALRESREKEQ